MTRSASAPPHSPHSGSGNFFPAGANAIATPLAPPTPPEQLRELKLLIRANHPILFLETIEEDRAEALIEQVAHDADLLYGVWSSSHGLSFPAAGTSASGTEPFEKCLDHIAWAKDRTVSAG